MPIDIRSSLRALTRASFILGWMALLPRQVVALDRLIGLHSAQVMSQSMPWIATEAGLFKKHDLDFRLVFIPSSPVATAASHPWRTRSRSSGCIAARAPRSLDSISLIPV